MIKNLMRSNKFTFHQAKQLSPKTSAQPVSEAVCLPNVKANLHRIILVSYFRTLALMISFKTHLITLQMPKSLLVLVVSRSQDCVSSHLDNDRAHTLCRQYGGIINPHGGTCGMMAMYDM
uniref:C-type lectin domain-containing protein n=1 Tax=Panagrellus redivivus TaxID=6233 RepID=A0A7E4ZUU9_PANRE